MSASFMLIAGTLITLFILSFLFPQTEIHKLQKLINQQFVKLDWKFTLTSQLIQKKSSIINQTPPKNKLGKSVNET